MNEREAGRFGARFQLVFSIDLYDVVVVVAVVCDGVLKLFSGLT